MDTFLIYHEVIMSLTTHLHQRRQLDIEAVAMDIATHLDALGALVRQSYSPDAAVEKEDATTQYCKSDCHDNGQKNCNDAVRIRGFPGQHTHVRRHAIWLRGAYRINEKLELASAWTKRHSKQ